jgi:hypothetical protein
LSSGVFIIAITRPNDNKDAVLEWEGNMEPSREPLASLFSLATFSWVDPIVLQGYNKILEITDIWNLAPKNKAAIILADYRRLKRTGKLSWHLLYYFR